MRTVRAALLCGLLLLGACGGGDEPSTAPTFGGGRPAAESDVATPELVEARAAAGIEPCPATSTDRSAAQDGLPVVTLPCLGGGEDVRLDQLRGRPHVINLWATWCPPCREELPVLQAAHTALGDRVGFVGVDYGDPDPAGALALAARSGVTYPLVSDPDESLRKPLGVFGLPQTVFVDADGTVVATERTAYDSEQELLAAVEKHLGVRP